MTTTAENPTSLSGKSLFYIFMAGAHNLLENQKELNRINVFPVPDGDTGTNLASTVRAIVSKMKPEMSYKKQADVIAEAALDGARGNSGVIFAQFLYGLGNETQSDSEITIDSFAESVKKAVDYMYQAIANPVEGTMITVIREWAEFIHENKERLKDFFELLYQSYLKALESLKETPKKLEVLAKANVVDAGAKGFVLFLEGILLWAKERNHRQILSFKMDTEIETDEVNAFDHDNITYRYCTEAFIEGKLINHKELRQRIGHMGDSLVIAGSPRKVRLHIHTDNPAQLFESIEDVGNIVFQKADDMVKQYQAVHERKFPIALVTDSTCDLPEEILEKYQIHVVPLNLFFGQNQYIDKISMSPDAFYRKQETCKDYPSTSQPSVQAFTNMFSHLSAHYESVIALHLSAGLSGTYTNSLKAAEKIMTEFGKPITVIDSVNISGSLGLIVQRAAKAIEAGKTHDEIVAEIKELSSKTHVFVSVKSMTTMIKGGRVSPLKGFFANMLHIRPVITIGASGKAELFDKAFSQKGNMRKTMKYIRRMAESRKIQSYGLLHGNNEDMVAYFHQEMRELTGIEPEFTVPISPVVGVSSGKDAAAVAIQFE